MVTRLRVGGEAGYTLAELLVSISIIGLVMAAVFGVYSTSQTAYLRSSSLENAQHESRAGIVRMLGEMQLIGAYWTPTPATAITAANPTSITFLGDVNGETVSAATPGVETTLASAVAIGATSITVSSIVGRDGTNPFAAGKDVYIANGPTSENSEISAVNGTTITVTALANSYPAGSIVRTVEQVTYTFTAGTGITRSEEGGAALTLVGNATGLTLSYFDGGGNSLGAAPVLANIREIGIQVATTDSGGGQRVMNTRVSLRNLR